MIAHLPRNAFIILFFAVLTAAAGEPAPVRLTLRANTRGYVVPADFAGLSFETGSELPNRNGVSGYLFSATNTALAMLFRNSGIHNLRLGGGSLDMARIPIPGPAEIDNVFAFVKEVGNLDVIYSLRLLNGDAGSDSATPGDAYLANWLWQHYQPWLAAFSLGNEPDWKSYHRQDPAIRDYPSYLNVWRRFAGAVRNSVPEARFAGPDTGSYTRSTFYRGKSWSQRFAEDERRAGLLACVTQHFYVGDKPGSLTGRQVRDAMLSAAWVNEAYPWLYRHIVAPVAGAQLPYRLTESNDYLVGIAGASDAFASALWALDYLHWWAAHGCAGVNFHNKAWLRTDTVYLDESGRYRVRPKAYGIKAFELGSHGQTVPLSIRNDRRLNLTAYAVADNKALVVTVINKEHGAGSRAAQVSLEQNLYPGPAAVMFLSAANADVAATNGITLGGASISDSNPWQGHWRSLPRSESGQCTLTVAPASAAIIKIYEAAGYSSLEQGFEKAAPPFHRSRSSPLPSGNPFSATLGLAGRSAGALPKHSSFAP